MPACVDPRDVVLSDRFDDQRVAFPMPDGVAEPGLLDLGIVRRPSMKIFRQMCAPPS